MFTFRVLIGVPPLLLHVPPLLLHIPPPIFRPCPNPLPRYLMLGVATIETDVLFQGHGHALCHGNDNPLRMANGMLQAWPIEWFVHSKWNDSGIANGMRSAMAMIMLQAWPIEWFVHHYHGAYIVTTIPEALSLPYTNHSIYHAWIIPFAIPEAFHLPCLKHSIHYARIIQLAMPESFHLLCLKHSIYYTRIIPFAHSPWQ